MSGVKPRDVNGNETGPGGGSSNISNDTDTLGSDLCPKDRATCAVRDAINLSAGDNGVLCTPGL